MERPEWNPKPNLFYAAAQYIYRQLRYNFDVLFNIKTYTRQPKKLL
jgi:hypothetical protein